MQVRDLSLIDALTSETMALRLRLRDEYPVTYVTRYKTLPVCTLLTTSPINKVWRFGWAHSIPYNEWMLKWELLLDRELIGKKRLLSELRKHGLKKRSAPTGYWPVGGDDYEDASRLMMTGGWYDNWCIPASMLEAVIRFQERWVQQLGWHCFIPESVIAHNQIDPHPAIANGNGILSGIEPGI